MSSEQTLLVVTAVLAAIALGAAFIAVRAVRRLQKQAAPEPASPAPSTEIAVVEHPPIDEPETAVARVLEGRVIVPPTSRQVVDATMGKPLVRVSVISHGLAHALRPESRDRIMAMMRREFQGRRRQRKRAARQAARLANPTPTRQVERPVNQAVVTNEAWLGELPVRHHVAPINREADS